MRVASVVRQPTDPEATFGAPISFTSSPAREPYYSSGACAVEVLRAMPERMNDRTIGAESTDVSDTTARDSSSGACDH
jgi:hypothetical protein